MPFKTTTSFPQSGRVRIILRGLLLIHPDSTGNSCEIGVHNTTNDHILQIAVTRSSPTTGNELLGFHCGKKKDTLTNPVSIRTEPLTGNGVYAYKPTPGEFDRTQSNFDDDLQWAIELQNPREFHAPPLDMHPTKTNPGIVITDGVFYSVERTEEEKINIIRQGGGKDPLNMHSIASVIGVEFELAAGSHVVVELHESDCSQTFRLPQESDPNDTTYEVYIRNDPPSYGAETGHDELEQYYDVLLRGGSSIEPVERFSLVTHLASKRTLLTTDRIPCIPGLLGGID